MPIKKADAKTLHSTTVGFINAKDIELVSLMEGFDGAAATFSKEERCLELT